MTYKDRGELENSENWRKWCRQIPFLQFDSEWMVKAVPPFSGALVRYNIECGDTFVSIYLDVNDSLGSVGQPYWEVHDGNDCERFMLHDVEELQAHLKSVLK